MRGGDAPAVSNPVELAARGPAGVECRAQRAPARFSPPRAETPGAGRLTEAPLSDPKGFAVLSGTPGRRVGCGAPRASVHLPGCTQPCARLPLRRDRRQVRREASRAGSVLRASSGNSRPRPAGIPAGPALLLPEDEPHRLQAWRNGEPPYSVSRLVTSTTSGSSQTTSWSMNRWLLVWAT